MIGLSRGDSSEREEASGHRRLFERLEFDSRLEPPKGGRREAENTGSLFWVIPNSRQSTTRVGAR